MAIVPDESSTWATIPGVSNSEYLETVEVNEAEVREALQAVLDGGITSIAVVFAHAYACPNHEQRVGAIAKELGFKHIVLSHEAMPMIRVVNRGHTGTPNISRQILLLFITTIGILLSNDPT